MIPGEKQLQLQGLAEQKPSGRAIQIRQYLSTRKARLCALIVLLILIIGTIIHASPATSIQRVLSLATSEDPVEAILRAAPLIDGHNDFAIWIRAFYHNHIYAENFTNTGELYGQVDFPRLREGRIGAQFWSVYVECPASTEIPESDAVPVSFSDEKYYENIHDTLQQIDLVHRLVQRFPDELVLASTAADIWANFKSRRNKNKAPPISSILGIEGLHQIGNSASILRMYHALGVRYASLTHTCHNRYADSSEAAATGGPLHRGLSAAGVQMVREMNRAGMIVDLSHTSFDTQRDALNVTRAPVIFSHSAAFSVCAHPRNVPDDVLRLLAANDGVVMVSFYPEHVHCRDPARAALGHVADHIQYIGELIGYRHVGIGSDFDGMSAGPDGLEDVSKYPHLLAELVRRGIGAVDLEGVVGANVLRVLREVELAAMQLGSLEDILEDDVKEFFG
ncbi:membrane dipeptidase-domain-containing protein [Nemania sp. FL0916]|nr:membrane dipeptidase-domain-containing protein [Nemania sp. FL0916]